MISSSSAIGGLINPLPPCTVGLTGLILCDQHLYHICRQCSGTIQEEERQTLRDRRQGGQGETVSSGHDGTIALTAAVAVRTRTEHSFRMRYSLRATAEEKPLLFNNDFQRLQSLKQGLQAVSINFLSRLSKTVWIIVRI